MYVCDKEGNVLYKKKPLLSYSRAHDLEWLLSMCRIAKTSRPIYDYDKAFNDGVDFVIRIIEEGMMPEKEDAE